MIRYAVIAAAAMLVPGVAQAQDWRVASVGEGSGSIFFIDADSIRPANGNAQVTAFVLMRQPDQGVSAIEATFEFVCKTGSRRVITMAAYDADENRGKTFDGDGKWSETPRETQFGALWEMSCGITALPDTGHGAARPFAAGRKLMAN